MTNIPFTKMVGTGNDFVVMDVRRRPLASLKRRWQAVSRFVCDRHWGVGADGLLVLERSRAADARMRVFNPDGSEAGMCGNGARCAALYLGGAKSRRVSIETKAGLLSADVRGSRVAMRMTDPRDLTFDLTVEADGRRFRLGFVDTGVPHAVVPVKALDAVEVGRLGRILRYHSAFAPRGANVNFIEPANGRVNRLRVRTYERGVEDETLACGTGVVASAIIYTLARDHEPARPKAGSNGRRSRYRVDVETVSGDVLVVSFQAVPSGGSARQVTEVVLEGGASRAFDGAVAWPPGRA